MAKVVPLQNQWHAGMKRDVPRDLMPAGAVWNAVDVIPSYGAPLRERGGWVHHSQDLSALSAGATQVTGGIYASFAAAGGTETAKVLAIDEDGVLYDATTAGAATSIGTGNRVIQNPVFHGGTAATSGTVTYTGLVIIPDGLAVSPPQKYDGTTMSVLNGTPPIAKYAVVHKDYTVLGNGKVGSTYYPDRIWFSPEGDPDCAVTTPATWDTTDSWISFSRHVKGLASNRSALLVFHDNAVTRIRGSIPPPDEDMIVDDGFFDIGLLDARSITNLHDQVIWASPEGVFRTDGAILDDLTRRGGMLRYWLDTVSASTSSWTFAGGATRDSYVLCVMNGATFVDCFQIDLLTLAWTRLSNVDAAAFWGGQFNKADELYWGRRGAARVCRQATVWSGIGDATYKNDGNGTAVAATVETQVYPLGQPGAKRVRRVFVTSKTTDYGSDDPTADVGYLLTPDATGYTSAGTLSEGTKVERKVLPIQKQAIGAAFRFQRSGAGDFALHAIEAEVTPYEQTRRIR